MNKPEVKSSKEDFFGDVDFYATEIGDTDKDGVNDFDDRCAGTPTGAKVDEFGCPLDDDTDVIENYRDDQAATPVESIVDLRGVSMNDSTIEARYKPEAGLKRSYIPILYPSGILEKAEEPKMTLGDSLKLIETMALIMESGKNQTPVDATLQEFAAEVKKVVGKNSNNPEAVYEAIEAVNNRLTQAANDPKKKKGAAPANAPLAGVNLENKINTSIPEQFRPADYDNNGIITSEEMQRVIEEALEGTGPFKLEQMYQLIDFYQDEMADVRVVDFGGTLGVYIDGELNILKNYKAEDKRTDAQRFLVNKFKEVDFNGDGILEPNEVQRMIDMFQEGKSSYTSDMINELIDLFFEQ
jgi:Ca2+-binding EF-hand superfamily protein